MYRIQLFVPTAYADEARVMLEEHPRTRVVDLAPVPKRPGSERLVVDSSDLSIIAGLWRWWMPHRFESRAQPPLALATSDDRAIPFDQRPPEELLALAAQNRLPDTPPNRDGRTR